MHRERLAYPLAAVREVGTRLVAPVLLLMTASASARAAEPTANGATRLPALAFSEPSATDAPPQTEELPVEETAPAVSSAPPLVITGYVDVGFAKAQGNGTSYPPGFVAPVAGAPVDYFVDTFAPAVNTRGEAASVNPSGQPVAGFFPRSAGIGGQPSFLLNTANVDLRYTSPEIPILVFTRVQVVPRLYGPDVSPPGFATGENTRLVLEQAFGRITPIKTAELAISVGKFDSVFGIEYLENQANFRIGVTPSLISRYTTGQSVGAKAFYRLQLVSISSAVSLNVAATNSGTFVEALQGPSRSLNGPPVTSARLGYELNMERVSFKLGASASYGPRNDQIEGSSQKQTLYGFDVRVVAPTLTVSGEYVHVDEQEADGPKLTGAGTFPVVTEFYAKGFYVQAAEELPLSISPFRLTLYGRYDRRHAEFEGLSDITVDRITGGINVGIGDNLQAKVEYLANRELAGAPAVANNVFTSSVVWTW